jgi:hypothetical protein
MNSFVRLERAVEIRRFFDIDAEARVHVAPIRSGKRAVFSENNSALRLLAREFSGQLA